MTHYIIGGGPAGMALALMLGLNGQTVVLLEKYHSLGGTWLVDDRRSQPSRHSPQIVSGAYYDTRRLFQRLNMRWTDYFQPYHSHWFSLLNDNLSLWDWWIMGLSLAQTRTQADYARNTSVWEGTARYCSASGASALETLCHLVDGVDTRRMAMWELFELFVVTLGSSTFIPKSDRFVREWTRRLEGMATVTIRRNVEVRRLQKKKDDMIVDLDGNDGPEHLIIERGDILVLACDPLGLLRLLTSSDAAIQNNWMPWADLARTTAFGMYVSISVQLEFENYPERSLPTDLVTGQGTEWGLICVIMPSDVYAEPVLFISILRLWVPSSMIETPPYYTEPSTLIKEVIRQIRGTLREGWTLPPIRNAYLGKRSRWNGRHWTFDISSGCRPPAAEVPHIIGKEPNLLLTGPVVRRAFPATTMEAAVEASVSVFEHLSRFEKGRIKQEGR